MNVINRNECPPQNWQGQAGLLNSSILNKNLTYNWKNNKTAVFLCGPAPMMKAVEKALITCMYNEKQINNQNYALA